MSESITSESITDLAEREKERARATIISSDQSSRFRIAR